MHAPSMTAMMFSAVRVDKAAEGYLAHNVNTSLILKTTRETVGGLDVADFS